MGAGAFGIDDQQIEKPGIHHQATSRKVSLLDFAQGLAQHNVQALFQALGTVHYAAFNGRPFLGSLASAQVLLK